MAGYQTPGDSGSQRSAGTSVSWSRGAARRHRRLPRPRRDLPGHLRRAPLHPGGVLGRHTDPHRAADPHRLRRSGAPLLDRRPASVRPGVADFSSIVRTYSYTSPTYRSSYTPSFGSVVSGSTRRSSGYTPNIPRIRPVPYPAPAPVVTIPVPDPAPGAPPTTTVEQPPPPTPDPTPGPDARGVDQHRRRAAGDDDRADPDDLPDNAATNHSDRYRRVEPAGHDRHHGIVDGGRPDPPPAGRRPRRARRPPRARSEPGPRAASTSASPSTLRGREPVDVGEPKCDRSASPVAAGTDPAPGDRLGVDPGEQHSGRRTGGGTRP